MIVSPRAKMLDIQVFNRWSIITGSELTLTTVPGAYVPVASGNCQLSA